MPITKSAKKALRKELKRRERNKAYLSKFRSLAKEIKKLIGENKIEEAKSKLSLFYKAVDKAAKVGVIHKNEAARRKSKLTKLLNMNYQKLQG